MLESRQLLSVSIFPTKSHASEINGSGAGHGVFTFKRTGPSTAPLTLAYSIDPQSTASADDIQVLSGSIVIAKGKHSATLQIDPVNDGTVEGTELLTLDVTPSAQYSVDPSHGSATMSIADNSPTIAIVASKPHAGSVKKPGQFTFIRSGKSAGPVTVNYTVDPSSGGVSGVDFEALSGSVTIPSGRSRATVNLVPAGSHGTQAIQLDLAAGSYVISSKQSAATVTIEPTKGGTTGNPVVDVSAAANASSAATPVTDGSFVVTRSGSTAHALTVSYTLSGTAVSGVDFSALSGSVTIAAHAFSANVDVAPLSGSTGSHTLILTVQNSGETDPTRTTATVTITGSTPVNPDASWWNTTWHDRLPISVNVGSVARTNKVVDQSVNFTTALSNLNQTGALNVNSIRVIETSADGSTVVDPNVPFQFDQAPDFNAATNAAGDMVIQMTGTTAANTTRYYHVYFDTGSDFTAATVTPQVTTTDNTSDEGQTTVTIATTNATYYLQKENGGFSSIVDSSGVDWLNFHNISGSYSSGEYRGLPNAVFGGGFHAGFTSGSTQIVSTGPLKTTLISTVQVDTGQPSLSTYKMEYEIYPTYVRATMLQADDKYWFLYEGTPGGAVNSDQTVVESDGTVHNIADTWNDTNGLGAVNGQDWVYFQDPTENRYLFMAQDTHDSLIDSYYLMNNEMTVFGFGRNNNPAPGENRAQMINTPNSFTFGLADGNDFNTASTLINGSYQPMTATTAVPQTLT